MCIFLNKTEPSCPLEMVLKYYYMVASDVSDVLNGRK